MRKHNSVSSEEVFRNSEDDNAMNKSTSSTSKKTLYDIFGFDFDDLTSFRSFCKLMFRPTDPSSLAVVRILFGLLMVVDTMEERGLTQAELRWGPTGTCHFPLFDFLRPLPLEWMCLLYFIMWLGAVGMMFGAWFHISCTCFVLPYWYLFLLDKSTWNNHSYLYGLLSTMFLFSSANYCWSVDGWLGRAPTNGHVPLWNYAILRFQVFILYFIAGLKKLDHDWLRGYSMSSLASHWLFDPFKLFMSEEEIDFWIIHLFGFLLDLTIGFWIYFDNTRPIAMVFLTAFHLMNTRLFSIGMFPYVCIATTPLFCQVSWPRKLLSSLSPDISYTQPIDTEVCIYPKTSRGKKEYAVSWYHRLSTAILLSHVFFQGFLPYSHFITQGYNNWTNGLYGYSWDMMVHTWNTVLIVVKVVDNDTGKEYYLDPLAWTHTDRYSKHGDMMVQYAQCLEENIHREHPAIQNISIHIDVWSSLNHRFQQRMFDPRVDLLTAEWSPFRPTPWLMPLLTSLSPWRQKITQLEQQVHSWSNYTDVLFVADFPGLKLENYIQKDLSNVTLTVLEGEVIVEIMGRPNTTMQIGDYVHIPTQTFHTVWSVSDIPSCYMYVYTNNTMPRDVTQDPLTKKPLFPLLEETGRRWNNTKKAVNIVSEAVLNIFCSVSMI